MLSNSPVGVGELTLIQSDQPSLMHEGGIPTPGVENPWLVVGIVVIFSLLLLSIVVCIPGVVRVGIGSSVVVPIFIILVLPTLGNFNFA